MTHISVALGVGKKAAGGTISSGQSSDRGGSTVIAAARPKVNPMQTSSTTASASTGLSQAAPRNAGRSESMVGSNKSVGRVSQSCSALKSLMDQGRFSCL